MPFKVLLENISKSFEIEVEGRKQLIKAIDNIDLEILDGQFYSIVGPSGCGKSTVLNIISGLIEPDGGKVLIDGANWIGRIHPKIGYVFQDDTVLPWYDVSANICLGMRYRRFPKNEVAQKLKWLLKLGQLEDFRNAYPFQLSGGMRRRVALLMTLATDPDILLMDEPFGALDTHTKTMLNEELLRIWSQTRQTIIFVTHDINEAIILSDKVVTLSSRPSHVKDLFDISIRRPRKVIKDRETDEFLNYYRKIWATLGEEFVK